MIGGFIMIHKKLLSVQNLVLVAMFTAILSILAQVSFMLPGGIPITLQTFSIVLAAVALGPKLGSLSVIVYILVGSVGFPVFANFKGGAGVLFGPTGGYLIGFIFLAAIIGLGRKKGFPIQFALCIAGLVVCHICGLVVYGAITHTFLPTAPILFAKDTATSAVALILGQEITKRITPLRQI